MERTDIHLTRIEISDFVKKTLNPVDFARISDHLNICEFCAEIIRRFTKIEQVTLNSGTGLNTDSPTIDAQKIFRQMFRGKSYSLGSNLDSEPKEYLLAADSRKSVRPVVENLATVFNGEPEIVLKVMRDNRKALTYLHLISDNPALYSHVLVQANQEDRSYMTDEKGRADIHDSDSFDAGSANWRVRLPDVELPLEPFIYNPDRIDYQKETILESGRGDKVKVTLESKEAGKQIKLEVLSLAGQANDGPLIASVSIGNDTTTHKTTENFPIYVNVEKLPTTVQIRLFK